MPSHDKRSAADANAGSPARAIERRSFNFALANLGMSWLALLLAAGLCSVLSFGAEAQSVNIGQTSVFSSPDTYNANILAAETLRSPRPQPCRACQSTSPAPAEG